MKSNSVSQAGFGLLEVLVSLTIFSSVGFTLLGWFQQNLNSVQRLRTFYAVQDARKTALEFARTLNPMLQPKGETAYGSVRIAWDSSPESEDVRQAGYPRGTGLHWLRLYNTTLKVYRNSETEPWFVENLTLIGHRRDALPNGVIGS